MNASQLLILDLVLGGVSAAAWAGAVLFAVRPPLRESARWALLALVAALLLTAVQVVIAVLLGSMRWEFVQEKALFALPVQLVTAGIAAGVAVPPVLRGRRGSEPKRSPWVPAALLTAGAAAVAGVLARAVIGYPLTLSAALLLTGMVLLTAWLGWAIFADRGRRQVAGAGALLAMLAVGGGGSEWISALVGPGDLAAHAQEPRKASAEEPVSVTDLRLAADTPGEVRRFALTAQKQEVTSASGRPVQAWTFGSLPGPELRLTEGDIAEVALTNRDIDAGATLHWHGVDLSNGDDGVAGATQDVVLPGERFTYRFLAEDPGTYWYHTHQSSADGIRRGLFGVLVVEPAEVIAQSVDVAVPLHTFGSTVWLGDSDLPVTVPAASGDDARLRLINTDQTPRTLRLTGAPYRIVAVDGRDVNEPTDLTGGAVRLAAGGRVDLAFKVPESGVLLTADSSSQVSVALGPPGTDADSFAVDGAAPDVDLLAYGSPVAEPPPAVTTTATMVLDRLPRFLGAAPANAYTVNGEVFPNIDGIEVDEGDVLRVTVVNRGYETHPMHLHGHHVLVESVNGVPSTGSPLMLDTFDVQPGETWVVRVVADNPGIWMFHCHNLDHAEEGMLMALSYRGVVTPFDHRSISG